MLRRESLPRPILARTCSPKGKNYNPQSDFRFVLSHSREITPTVVSSPSQTLRRGRWAVVCVLHKQWDRHVNFHRFISSLKNKNISMHMNKPLMLADVSVHLAVTAFLLSSMRCSPLRPRNAICNSIFQSPHPPPSSSSPSSAAMLPVSLSHTYTHTQTKHEILTNRGSVAQSKACHVLSRGTRVWKCVYMLTVVLQLLAVFDTSGGIEVNVTPRGRSSKLCNNFKPGEIQCMSDQLGLSHTHSVHNKIYLQNIMFHTNIIIIIIIIITFKKTLHFTSWLICTVENEHSSTIW